jgi:AcrR family transcriptional regulator
MTKASESAFGWIRRQLQGGSMTAKTARDRGVEVRQRIEQAAIELVCEVGRGGVSTRLLAERAGVTPGLVHYHYRSIDDALRTAMVGAIDTLVGELDRALAGVGSAEEAMAVVWTLLDPYPADAPESVLLLESVLAAMRDPELRDRMAEAVGAFRGRLADRLRESGVDRPEATAAVLAATIDGVMMHRILFDDLSSQTVRPVVERLLHDQQRDQDRQRDGGQR